MENFKSDIANSFLFEDQWAELTVDELAASFDATLTSILDDHAPLLDRMISDKPQSPWFTSDLRLLKREKRRQENKWLKSGTPTDYAAYKEVFKQYYKQCKITKNDYFSSRVKSFQGDQKQLFKLIDGLSTGNRATPYPDMDDQTLSDRFSNFFKLKIDNIVDEVQSRMVSEDIRPFPLNSISEVNLSTLKAVNELEVKRIIADSPSKTSVLDPMPISLMKDCMDVLIKPIHAIISKSLSTGLFPRSWKTSSVVPILKKPNLDIDFRNYRPISNFSFISKILEKAALKTITEHLYSTGHFATLNSAYKRNYSTETLITKLNSDILSSIDNQNAVISVLLDLSAAFDSVNQNILLDTCTKFFNITGDALHWIRSYITNRTQRVKISEYFSDEAQLNHGVPQGSCVGPVAFLMYISPLYSIIQHHFPSIAGYADDHQLYIPIKAKDHSSIIASITSLENCIHDVRSFMIQNQLKINDSKTEIIIIGSKQQLAKIPNITVKIGNENIQPRHSVLNLGVTFDSSMSLNEHINNVSRKANFQLIRIRPYLSEQAAEILIHAFVTSTLDYCNSIYYNIPDYQLYKL